MEPNDISKELASLPPTTISINSGKISYTFIRMFKKEENFIVSYIPVYNLHFSAKTEKEAEEKGKAIMNSFYNFYIKNEGWRKFVLKIHTLGFRTTGHDMAIKNLLNSRPVKRKFNIKNPAISSEYLNMEGAKMEVVQESILA